MPFTLPETLPDDIAELHELRVAAGAEFDELKELVENDGDITDEQLAQLRAVADAIHKIDAAVAAVEAAATEKRDEARALIDGVLGNTADEDDEATDADVADVIAEAEQIAETAPEAVTASTGTSREIARTQFSKLAKGKPPAIKVRDKNLGWHMAPGSIGYKAGAVGFGVLAEAIDSVRPGTKTRSNRGDKGEFSAQTLATLRRELPEIGDPHALVAAIEKATDERNLPGGSLTAAGGWCSPSETLYDFCEVPTATDLLSLPEITIRRGGVRWPIEPDLSAIFASFQFFFTELELQADPTKTCVEIPCAEDFDELRLNAVGYCVNAGILQDQGWPELTDWFLRSLTAEHFRAISRRSINDMVAGSTVVVIPANSVIATGSAFLNALALMATNLRLKKGLSRTATIEGVAPSWVPEAIRADAANQGIDTANLSDAQISGWLAARNIAIQWVADWQTRDVGKPGHLATVRYPTTVDVLLYPAGTWFRALSNVIELGTLYDKTQLTHNRFTRFFTEDAIAVGKRCNDSLVVNVPICTNGAIGGRSAVSQVIDCSAAELTDEVQTLAQATGTSTAGTFTLTFDGQTTAPIAYNATAAAVQSALEALSNVAPGDIVAGGGALPATPITLTFGGAYANIDVPLITANSTAMTGGTYGVTETVKGGQ